MFNPQLIHTGAALHPMILDETEQIRTAYAEISRTFFYSPRFTYQRSKKPQRQ
jgi:hypothetical protein